MIDWNTGVWVYKPNINGLGNEVVYDKLTVEVSDGLHSESVEWDIKLDGENDAPEIVEGHGQEQLSADWGGSVIFDINAYDYYAEIDIYSSSSNLDGCLYAVDPEQDEWTWSFEYDGVDDWGDYYYQHGEYGTFYFESWGVVNTPTVLITIISTII